VSAHPDSPRAATGRCELQATPQNPTSKTPPPNRLTPIHPRPRGTGTHGLLPRALLRDSPPPAGDRCPGSADVLVGTRFSPARGGQVCTAFSGTLGPANSAPSAAGKCAASQSLRFGLLCPSKKRTDQKLNQAPRMPIRVLVSPADGARMYASPPRFRVLCPPRAGVDTRSAWPGVDSAGRHRGLPLRAAKHRLTRKAPRAA
jgi:hypothetical protein